jgi:hypothetical protein
MCLVIIICEIRQILITFFFFFDMFIQEGGRGIRTSNFHFIRRGLSRLSYFLGTAKFNY